LNFGEHIATITTLEEGYLYAVEYIRDETDILDVLFDQWTDTEYLVNYLDEKSDYLNSGHFTETEIANSVGSIVRDVSSLKRKLAKASKTGKLDQFFKPYTKGIQTRHLEPLKKAYGTMPRSMLRLYAVCLQDGSYIICGGAIKLTKDVDGDEELQKERARLNRLRDYLKQEGIEDTEQLDLLILDLEEDK
jgi:hypothetical protein